jgi:hypothetical protein
MPSALVTFATESVSKTPFFIVGGALVLFALLLTALGLSRRATFPPSRGVQAVVTVLMLALVAGAMATAVITA